MSSPTQRALRELRGRGWTAQVVEKWIPQAKRRVDLFGCIDIVALDGLPGVLGVQVTDSSNVSKRVAKAKEEERIARWLMAGNRFEVWGYAKRKPRGAKRPIWTLRTVKFDKPHESEWLGL